MLYFWKGKNNVPKCLACTFMKEWNTLTLAHLRIGHMEGNPEVGNSEYMGHQDCPPQLVCFLVAQYSPWVSSEHVGSVFREHSNYCTPRRIYVQTEMNDESSLFKKKVNFDHCSSASNLSLFHYLFKLILSFQKLFPKGQCYFGTFRGRSFGCWYEYKKCENTLTLGEKAKAPVERSRTNAINVTLHPHIRQVIWEPLRKHTLERSQTNVINAILPLLMQKFWENIWKRTVEKSQTNVINVIMPLLG